MVEYVKAGETKLPIRVSYKVLKKVSTLSDESEGEYARIEALLFYSLENGAKAEGTPFTLTKEGLEDLIDKYPELIGQFTTMMTSQVDDIAKKMSGSKSKAVIPTGTR